jgi:hypothetical protein
MFYTDPTGKRVSRDQAMIGDRLRAGFNAVFEDGERARMRPGDYLGFDISMVDSAPARSSVFLTDSKRTGEQGVEAARRRWMADKSTAYRGVRTATVAIPSSVRQTPTPTPAPAAPRPFNDAQARSKIEAARQAWLAEKQTAYRKGGC